MTDNEIIKALECCKFQTKTHCSECPIFPWSDCHAMVVRNALDLINRQKVEIDNYKKPCSFEAFANIRTEAIKDFAERLKEKAYYCEKKDGKDNFVVDEMDIDNLVKEMVGE